jgi:NTE family protein
VSFEGIVDPAERRWFYDVPTSFKLDAEQVDRLRDVAGRLLRASPEFQQALADLGGAAPAPKPLSEHPAPAPAGR